METKYISSERNRTEDKKNHIEAKYVYSDKNQTGVKPEVLRPVMPDEFLPSIGRWLSVGGIGLLTLFVTAVALSSVLKYKVTVKAPAVIRPVGGLRLVQSHTQGIIKDLTVRPNQVVEKGEPIAIIDDMNLQTKKSQLEENIRENTLQLNGIQVQLENSDNRIKAETDRMHQAVAAAEAELSLQQSNYQTQKMTAIAEINEAEAALDLARDELARYKQLAGTGAVPKAKIQEKETALKTATARLAKIKARSNPSSAEIAIAKANIAREQAAGQSALTGLYKEQEQLIQQKLELQSQLNKDRQALNEVKHHLEGTIVRAPEAGIIQKLNLQNISQFVGTGDVIAEIAPLKAPLEIKALVAPQDIARVETEQVAQMRVSACPYPEYGTLDGVVASISPDAMVSQPLADAASKSLMARVGASTYEVTIEPENEVLNVGKQNCQIQSGMEGTIDIITKEETVLRFILRKAKLIADVGSR